MAFLAGLGIRCNLAKAKMKNVGATSEETAKKPEELDIKEWVLNCGLAKLRGIKRTEDGRYYVECKDGKHC